MVCSDPDEFIELLVKYHDGRSKQTETRYVKQQLQEKRTGPPHGRMYWSPSRMRMKKNGHAPVQTAEKRSPTRVGWQPPLSCCCSYPGDTALSPPA